MRKTIWDQYRNKLRSADEAVKVVNSGDWVYYSHFAMTPVTLDRALAKRTGEITDVKISLSNGMHLIQAAACDPQKKTFTYNSTFYSKSDRNLAKQGLAFFIPANYHEQPWRCATAFLPNPMSPWSRQRQWTTMDFLISELPILTLKRPQRLRIL